MRSSTWKKEEVMHLLSWQIHTAPDVADRQLSQSRDLTHQSLGQALNNYIWRPFMWKSTAKSTVSLIEYRDYNVILENDWGSQEDRCKK
jgi:hypothetical protein